VIVTFIEEKPQMHRKKYGLEPAASYCLIKILNQKNVLHKALKLTDFKLNFDVSSFLTGA